nr:hypothetical protein [Tanacetum cinerariifolium]
MEILPELSSNSSTVGTLPMLQPHFSKVEFIIFQGTLRMLQPRSSEVKFILSSFQCQISFGEIPLQIKTTLHTKLTINQECQELRSNPSKDKENITGRRSQVRDLDSGEMFKTSTLGEIVSLEKSNKNVIGPRILTSIQSKTILDICPKVKGVNCTDVPNDDTTLAFLINLGYKGESISIHITLSFHTHQEIDQQYPIVAKITILDTGKFEQWQFWIQKYLQHEHYALWEATKKTKKNLLKQQYGNFRAEGSETLEQTFSRLHVIVSQLQFMDIEVEQDDLNQKFLTRLAPEWLMHTIVWRNMSDLDTMSLDDLYNHLKVYESKVQKKSEPNSQNMAFISLAKHSSGNEDGNTACVPTTNTNVPTASASIDEDDMEEMDIKWNMALLSVGADKFWKRTGKKISIQGSDGSQKPRQRKERQLQAGSKAEKQAPKALMAIDGVGWDWSYMANDGDDHALVADEEAPTEFALMANTSTNNKVFENSLCSKDCKKNNESLNKTTLKQEKEGFDGKLAGLLTASKDIDNLIESQRSDKNKEGLGYVAVPPPPVQLYFSPKKDLSWTGLPECADDTVTDYSRPSPTVESTSEEDQNRNPSVYENVASPITPKPFIKFVKPKDSQSKSKTYKKETSKKPPVKYAEQYRKLNKKPNVRGNQRNWNNLKSHQLGPDFAHSYGNRPFHRTSAVRSPYRPLWVPTVNRKFPTGSTKSPTADMEMKGKAVNPSAYWAVPRTKLMIKAIGTVAALGT